MYSRTGELSQYIYSDSTLFFNQNRGISNQRSSTSLNFVCFFNWSVIVIWEKSNVNSQIVCKEIGIEWKKNKKFATRSSRALYIKHISLHSRWYIVMVHFCTDSEWLTDKMTEFKRNSSDRNEKSNERKSWKMLTLASTKHTFILCWHEENLSKGSRANGLWKHMGRGEKSTAENNSHLVSAMFMLTLMSTISSGNVLCSTHTARSRARIIDSNTNPSWQPN